MAVLDAADVEVTGIQSLTRSTSKHAVVDVRVDERSSTTTSP